jgi:hypothetical protein
MSAARLLTPLPNRQPRLPIMESPAMQRSLSPSRQNAEALQFRLILAATYPFFLAAALLQRVLPGRSGMHRGLPAARRSVFGEAKAMAVSAIPFAFMG